MLWLRISTTGEWHQAVQRVRCPNIGGFELCAAGGCELSTTGEFELTALKVCVCVKIVFVPSQLVIWYTVHLKEI